MNEEKEKKATEAEDCREQSGETGARPILEDKEPEGIHFSDKALERVREEARETVLEESKLTPEQRAIWDQIAAEAQMPINLTNKDFKLGPQELDIRNLNTKNILQMLFRVGVLDNVYLKQLLNVGLDIIRLLMVIASQMGVENITRATDDVLEKEKAANNLENLEVGKAPEKEKKN